MMSIVRSTRCLLAAAIAATAWGAAQATPVTVFGEDPTPAQMVDPDKAPAQSRLLFESRLKANSLKTESFETQPLLGTGPYSILGGLATLSKAESGLGEIDNRTGGSFPTGRFNTTPDCADNETTCAWWQSSGSFSIDFGSTNAISAFGFYATDLSDYGGVLELELTDLAGVITVIEIRSGISAQVDSNGMTVAPPPNGTLAFFGFTDTDTKYTKVRFDISQPGPSTDFLGFDDIVIGDVNFVPNTVPEPASLALVALSLAALAATRRKAAAQR